MTYKFNNTFYPKFNVDTGQLGQGVVSYWSLGEKNDYLKKDIVNGNHFYTATGITVFNEDGPFNACTSFITGSLQSIDDNLGIMRPYNYQDFSFSIWVRNDDLSFDATPLTTYKATGNSRVWSFLYLNSTNTYNFIIYQSGTSTPQISIASSTITVGEWNHYAFWLDTTTQEMYLAENGAIISSASCVDMFKSSGVRMRFGSTDDNLAHFKGKISQIIQWDRILTEKEVSILYNNGTGSYIIV